LSNSSNSRYLCFISDFWGNAFSFVSLIIMLSIGLLYIAFIILRCKHSIPSFLRAFEWMLDFCQRLFVHLLRWYVIFVLYSVYIHIMFTTLHAYETSLHSWNETNFIMVYDLLNVLLNSICKYLFKIFMSIVIKEIVLFF
jgi:hypothetical protein